MLRRPPLALLIASLAVLTVAGPASALTTHRCRESAGFRCGTVTVPLDRTGAVPGTVKLSVAIEDARKGASGYLVALSGGPGQPAVPFASSFRSSLGPALAHRRLVVFDQRGTGGSGVLSCRPLQVLGTLDVVNTHAVERCANALGPRRNLYSTNDSVLDLDAVRAAIGAPKLQVMGISYGTFAAAQYARQFPDRTEGLILDSVVGPDGIDAYFLDTFERLGRVLAEQCARRRCRGATKDPNADLAKVTAALQRGALRGAIPGALGAPHATAIHDESELLLLIMSGDLNPYMQAALPGAMNAAAAGDEAPLLRMRRLAQGPSTPPAEFSSTLNVATTCADVGLPYTFATPYPDRWTAWRHGADALPDSAFAPFSRAAVIDTSLAHDCLRWPFGDPVARPSSAPLPDVPALLLSGRLDTRTPVENAREVQALMPHAQLLTVAGTGHDVLDSDITGCAARALRRWADGRAVGDPCAGRTNAVTVQARPPLKLSAYRSAPGVGGTRGRVLFAALDTVVDGQLSALETLYAGFTRLQGGGLRAGSFTASNNAVRLRLHGYSLLPGLRVSGVISATGDRAHGAIAVDGPDRYDGRLRLHSDGKVSGRLGGRRVRYVPGARRAAVAAGTSAGAGRGARTLLGGRAVRAAAAQAAALRPAG
jgi:pimeloyl-ACP methyl ester carboxylesterase